jgi:hypothetical protein
VILESCIYDSRMPLAMSNICITIVTQQKLILEAYGMEAIQRLGRLKWLALKLCEAKLSRRANNNE